eukprot:762749-Hanusia_phi.AAC.3
MVLQQTCSFQQKPIITFFSHSSLDKSRYSLANSQDTSSSHLSQPPGDEVLDDPVLSHPSDLVKPSSWRKHGKPRAGKVGVEHHQLDQGGQTMVNSPQRQEGGLAAGYESFPAA